MSATPKETAKPSAGGAPDGGSTDACANGIDPTAPAGSRNSLGAKSDCGGRPATDDSVVEAKDEMGPGVATGADPAGDSGRG